MAKKEKKTNKENKHYFRDLKAEIKKVIWPTSKQLVNTTVAIITMVIVVSIIVFGLDLAFDAMNKYGLTKLQETAQNFGNNDEDNESEDTTDSTEDSTESTDEASTVDEESEDNSATE